LRYSNELTLKLVPSLKSGAKIFNTALVNKSVQTLGARKALSSQTTMAQQCAQNALHVTQIKECKLKFLADPSLAFDGDKAIEPSIDSIQQPRKIG
jgi:hypothetical protein